MTFATQMSAAFTPIAATYDTPSVTRALSWAQSFVEGYCNRYFDAVTSQVDFVSPKPYRTAMLPNTPVTNIESVQALLPPITSSPPGGLVWTTLTNYMWVQETGLLYDTTGEPGVIWALGPSWPWLPGSLQVTYDYGYVTIPQELVDVGCRFAQQYLENPALQMARKVGDLQDTYFGGYSTGTNVGSVGVIINDQDRRILGRYVDISIA